MWLNALGRCEQLSYIWEGIEQRDKEAGAKKKKKSDH